MTVNLKKFVADMVGQSQEDFFLREKNGVFTVFIKARNGGGFPFLKARPIGQGFDLEVIAPRAFYLAADGRLLLSDRAEDYE